MKKRHARALGILITSIALALGSVSALAEVQQVSLNGTTLKLDTDTNDFTISALGNNSFQVTFLTDDTGVPYTNLPSMALPELTTQEGFSDAAPSKAVLEETTTTVTFGYGDVAAQVDKRTHVISYTVNGKVVAQERNGLSVSDSGVSLSFALDENEKLYGGGQRVLGMDRRGHSMPLYNKAHYGYTTSSNQMY